MNRLNNFRSFNESEDSGSLRPSLLDPSSVAVGFEFITTTGTNSLAIMDEAKMFTLTHASGRVVSLTYSALVANKELIVSLEQDEREGESLYRYIVRALSYVEFDKQSDVSKWTTFEALQNDELDDRDSSAIAYRYYHGDECYRIIVNPETNTIITYFSPRVVAIRAEEFYSANTGLIDLHDGKIEEYFYGALKSSGIDMSLITRSKEAYLRDRTKRVLDINNETDLKKKVMFNRDRHNEYLSDLMSNSEALISRAQRRLEETTMRLNKYNNEDHE
jgi:hypothetical protein